MRVANLAVIQLFTDDNMAANTPKVVSFGFKNYEFNAEKRTAKCKTCDTKISDGPQTTSNFVRHLKTHKDR